ncbi:HAD-superfamily hydrolase, subfamily IIB [Thioalkalivibrio nitratireducens DSM 14787]|uniref:HAD-superfamily hydrolase, subfamily IIB n=1 Tax=Thioalkalivibrio nitratireducens (strain DSM 14787 / UNIQEM 213 / ALEN2) TaxID=1255043 RepID=L0DZW7_THIND|nr:HAD hydrolase family protein [Thioalkalivibrio nitratireducens]AGA34542.1 HAD-superfamily hydrolase, subfamily IIB [Thioalkalivibrio nitratireducens DSM 14787]
MHYLALAADYDGTLASRDRISEDTVRAVERLRKSGRRAILVTGRRVDDLLSVCPCARLFDLVVAENGAVVYNPATREEHHLANPPPKLLIKGLQERGVEPLEIGQVLVGTHAAHRAAVQDVIWELGLEAQVIGNRDALTVLPAGINKAKGLERALRKLGLSRHEVVGVGDAENDHSFLDLCECSAAVANAVPSLKAAATFVTKAENGSGVIEVIDEVIADDLHRLDGRLEQHLIPLGTAADGTMVNLPPFGHNMLVAGPSGSGKSTLTAGIIERLIEKDFQVCIVDPEGDYGTLGDVVALGNQWRAPSVTEILSILEDPKFNLSINLLGIPLGDRPAFLAQLVPNLQALRARTGRPHWLVLDEAHHMLPDTWGHTGSALPKRLGETLLVTVHPEHVAPEILAPIDIVIAIGASPQDTLARFGRATGRAVPWPEDLSREADQVVAWFVSDAKLPFAVRPMPGRAERMRHHRKYAEGDLRWHSFYFRGPDGRHNLKAQNLAIFCQIAQGIDEETWLFRLRRGDYSRWFRHAVRDEFLAEETQRFERRTDLPPAQTRQMLTELVQARYTLPE